MIDHRTPPQREIHNPDPQEGLSDEKQQYDATSAINEVRNYVDAWRSLLRRLT